MATLVQSKKIFELHRDDWVTIDHPEHEGLDPWNIPIGGPVIMKAPDGKLFEIGADGTVLPYD